MQTHADSRSSKSLGTLEALCENGVWGRALKLGDKYRNDPVTA